MNIIQQEREAKMLLEQDLEILKERWDFRQNQTNIFFEPNSEIYHQIQSEIDPEILKESVLNIQIQSTGFSSPVLLLWNWACVGKEKMPIV